MNAQTKVIHQKMICYVSSFHLSINDWFSEYENIEILKVNLQNGLGKYIRLIALKCARPQTKSGLRTCRRKSQII